MSPTIRQTWDRSRTKPEEKPHPRQQKYIPRALTVLARGVVKIISGIGSITHHLLVHTPRMSFKKIGSFFLVGGFFAGILGLLLVVWYSRDLPDPNRLIERPAQQSTQILDRTGTHVLYEIYDGQKRSLITLSDIPKHVINATIAAEDRDFYTHSGFDLTGITRALYKDIIRGGAYQGGSTITQQLVKNAILTRERTIGRKIREAILAWRIEQKFTKNQILQLYLNEIPYGSTLYGIESASQAFFRKHANDLTLAEGALIAAVPKAPSYYFPFGTHTDALLARQQSILSAMAELGMITAEDAQKAKEEPVLSHLAKQRTGIIAPHFVFYVKQLLAEQYGDQFLERGGLKVITTLDVDKQKIAEDVINERADDIFKKYNGSNAALVSIDVPTGDILAMVGSKDYFNDSIDGQVNVTLQPRQPGSSFKPLVYALAFERGFTPDTVVYDVHTVFKNYPKDYAPKNYDGKEHGAVSLRAALAGSLNIPAVQVLSIIGIDSVLDRARVMGYTTLNDRSRFGLSLVLGGGEVTLLEHTNAYATFAREGSYRPHRAILQIKDATGTMVVDTTNDQPPETRVFDQQTTRTLTSILSDNNARAYIFGIRNALTLPDRPVAVKTGSTNDFHDAWTVGYTPSFVTGVWVGNNNNDALKNSASTVAAPVWQAYMSRVLAKTPVEQFTAPEPKEIHNPYLTGLPPGEQIVRINRTTGLRANASTPQELLEDRVYHTGHSILHVVDPLNPDGPPPSDPSKNPQYINWEAAVQNWFQRHGIRIEVLPAYGSDTTHKIPLILQQPTPNASITTAMVPLILEYITSYPATVSVFINDILLQTTPAQPTITFSLPPALENGFYTLHIVINDAEGGEGSVDMPINVVLPSHTTSPIMWQSPVFGTTFSRIGFSATFQATAPPLPTGSFADLILRSVATNTTQQITRQTDLKDSNLSFTWRGPIDVGTYAMTIKILQPGQPDLLSDELYFGVR